MDIFPWNLQPTCKEADEVLNMIKSEYFYARERLTVLITSYENHSRFLEDDKHFWISTANSYHLVDVILPKDCNSQTKEIIEQNSNKKETPKAGFDGMKALSDVHSTLKSFAKCCSVY